MLMLAEGSTGGLLGHLLTMAPGSSVAFLGGVIAYGNRLKELIGVPKETIEKEGAVSAPAAQAMAEAARCWSGADLALSVTGIAGPGGGTPGKPVGLTFIALAGKDGSTVEEHRFDGDRDAIKMKSAMAGLAMLHRLLAAKG